MLIIKVKKYTKYREVRVVADNTHIELGMMDEEESQELAKHLREVADELEQ